MNYPDYDFTISDLGEKKIASPLNIANFISDNERLLFDCHFDSNVENQDRQALPLSIELAGPRKNIFFNPARTKAAIVTCGGLCPGINDVIRSITMELFYRYGVKDISGIKYGFRGLIPEYGHRAVQLSPEIVKDITHTGGSLLSCSRGHQDINQIIKYLSNSRIDILFCIGGDGTMRAVKEIAARIMKRNLNIAIVGIPKTIDNDLNLIEKSFGFDTAIAQTVHAIRCAHVEAKGAVNGIGLIKIMGRLSGHIAANAALAQNDTNFVLIPEVPFSLHGEKGLLATLEKRVRSRGHAVVLVAEGAGQDLLRKSDDPVDTDPSGNLRLYDVGIFLKNEIENYFQKINQEINLKYIEPSYMIRSVPANASDSIYCSSLGQYAVHAAMAGKTGLLVALMRDEYVHLPLTAAVSRRRIDPQGNLWLRVLEATGQPPVMKD
ncbi:MAG: ATP-dependent 6-phosphofructokinase [Smithellaceae bacterium]